MAAVAQAIESAQHEILIMDWWLNPELVCYFDGISRLILTPISISSALALFMKDGDWIDA